MSSSVSRSPRSFWPLGLIVSFTLFVAGTGTLIWLSRQANLDLVRPDYYEAESIHAEETARRQRAANLPSRLQIRLDPQARVLQLQMPPGHETAQGRLEFYRPSAAAQDEQRLLGCDASGSQTVSLQSLAPGLWRLRVLWQVDGTEYAESTEFVLPAVP